MSAGTGVAVTAGGLFSVQLGDVASLPVGIFTNQNLYFEIELPTPATATCSAANCESYIEGAMTPRNKLGSSAYAFNSDTLDGYDSSYFAVATGGSGYIQNTGTPQTASFNITGSGTIGSTLTVGGATQVKVTSTTALQVQNASSAPLLTVDTSASQVVVGDLTNGVSLSTSGLQYYGTARPNQKVTLSAEYPGATFTADGSNNQGSLSSDFCSGRLSINTSVCSATVTHNYYQWTTSQSSAQDYDVYVRYQLPSNYDSGSLSNLSIWGWGTSTATEQVILSMYVDSITPACSTSANAVSAAGAWAQATVASPLGSCAPVAGDMVTFKVHLQAGQNNFARAGGISFGYRSKM